jgi:hypothetical protein
MSVGKVCGIAYSELHNDWPTLVSQQSIIMNQSR